VYRDEAKAVAPHSTSGASGPVQGSSVEGKSAGYLTFSRFQQPEHSGAGKEICFMPRFVLTNKNRRGRPQALICCGTFPAAGYVSGTTLSDTKQNVKEIIPNLARKT